MLPKGIPGRVVSRSIRHVRYDKLFYMYINIYDNEYWHIPPNEHRMMPLLLFFVSYVVCGVVSTLFLARARAQLTSGAPE